MCGNLQGPFNIKLSFPGNRLFAVLILIVANIACVVGSPKLQLNSLFMSYVPRAALSRPSHQITGRMTRKSFFSVIASFCWFLLSL
ncbi:unnamed protein product [Periconia digitata]|uniref:Uncharacterized protein n=1 Tax=Periconia digitata TaxID=1303443 RepID=A0A9W4UP20_9PLEO|nr:unnamed protein product [Periconia digitata]